GKLPALTPPFANPGEVMVVVTAPGYEEQRVQGKGRAGETITITIDLKRHFEPLQPARFEEANPAAVAGAKKESPSPQPPALSLASAAPVAPPPSIELRKEATPLGPATSGGSSWHRTGALLTGGLAVASLAVGGAAHFIRHTAASDFGDPARGCDNSGG